MENYGILYLITFWVLFFWNQFRNPIFLYIFLFLAMSHLFFVISFCFNSYSLKISYCVKHCRKSLHSLTFILVCSFLLYFLFLLLSVVCLHSYHVIYTSYSWLNKAALCRPTFCSNILDELSLTWFSLIKELCIISYELSFED